MTMLVLGTHNRKKGLELQALVAPSGIEVKTLGDIPDAITVVEDGDSFAANAALKAGRQADHLRQWVVGEDSGICVEALEGAPGIYSARFSGAGATDESNNAYLLKKLQGVPLEERGAQYICSLALADPTGQIRLTAEGSCRGRIRTEPKGTAGFGYDPLFEILEYHRTFGELGDAIKAMLSHRARAMRQFVPALLELLSDDPQ
jgi:XTP/dITP diphosphohydrolase